VDLPADVLAQQCCEVWPENWEAMLMFGRIATQWRIGPNGRTGLDYTALSWLLSLYPVPDPRQLFEDLQVMEAAILEADHG
jgi:hypothetical protein